MRKTILAIIITAGMASAAPAQANQAKYCDAMGKAAESVATARDMGQPMIKVQMAAAGSKAPAHIKAEVLGLVQVIYTDPNLQTMTPEDIAGLTMISCLDIQRKANG